jgi:hypothetical protein
MGGRYPVVPGTFFCRGCSDRHADVLQHPSGFCTVCIQRGHRFWETALPPAELAELLRLWSAEGPERLERAA